MKNNFARLSASFFAGKTDRVGASVFMPLFLCFYLLSGSAYGATYQPNGTSSFTGAATYCQSATATPLTFTYTSCNSGGGGPVGTPCNIRWYYNLTNSTATGTATLVSGPTAFTSAAAATGNQTYTPSTTTVGARYYFCTITRTNAGCAGGAGSVLTSSTTQLITINALPTTVTVSGGGTFCTSSTITAANGGSGTMYYQGTTSNGTSTATPSSSQVISTVGTNTYYFRARSAAGCWGVQGSVTVTIVPIPGVYTVMGGGSYCAGGAGVDVSLSNSDNGVTYQLYNGTSTVGGVVSGIGGALDFGPQVAAGTYTVLANPSTACATGMSGTAVVTINAIPTLTSTLTPPDICSSTLFDYSPASSLGGTVFNWSRGLIAGISNSAATGLDDPAETLINTTTNPVAVTYTYTLDAAGCSNSQDVVVNVNPTPQLNSSLTPPSICNNSLFSYTPTSATAGTTFGWSRDVIVGITNPAAFGVDDPAETLINTSTDPIAVIYVDTLTANGCVNTQDVTVIVNPTPLLITPLTAPDICSNTLFSYTPASFTAGTTFDWSRSAITGISNAAATGSGDPAEVLVNTTSAPIDVTYIYTLTINGCTNVEFVDVTVDPTPIVTVISGNNNVCAGATITLTDGIAGGTWSCDNIGVATVSGTGVVSGVSFGSANIFYTVSNSFMCSASVAFPIMVGNTMPSSAILPVDTSLTICHGISPDLTLVTTGTGLSYQWFNGSTPITGATGQSYVASVPGDYTLVINNGTCSLDLPTTHVVAPPYPTIGYDITGPNLFTGGYATYQWFMNGVAIPGANSSVYPVTTPGMYTVVVGDANGCYDTSGTFNYPVSLGVKNPQAATAIRVYPNPATTTIYVDAPVVVSISVISVDGKTVAVQPDAASINVTNLSAGLYFIKIVDENDRLLKIEKFSKTE